MNVLSLFDGMSCGQIALDQLDFKVDNYYAAEIDKYAMSIAKKNYPNTIHLGDVTELRGMDLPKIDLLMGGSPCQGFSFAGKQLNFDDPRSALFFEFVRLLEETKPKYFLLENVRMKQEYQDVISEHLGVKPIMINSSLLSAQNRVRFYWTNIPGITQPEDKGIVLKDILEDLPIKNPLSPYMVGEFDGVSRLDKGIFNFTHKNKGVAQTAGSGHGNKYLINRPCEPREFNKESLCHHAATATDIKGNESIKRVYAETGKSPTLTTMGGGHREPKVLCGRIVGRKINSETGKRDDYNPDIKAVQRLEPRLDEKCGTLTTVQKDNVIITPPTYRKLTPLECERLQTVPDNYTEGVSNTQRYKMLGNGWTVAVIKHIFKGIEL